MDSVYISTLNINGIRNKLKRKRLFQSLKQKKYDIICLQETFIVESDKELWEKEWGGEIFFSSVSNQSMGQVTLIRKGFPYGVECLLSSQRLLTVAFQHENFKVNVVNVYAPCTLRDKETFFQSTTKYIHELEGEKLVCGDFNCVLSNDSDIVSGGPHRQNDVYNFQNMLINSSLCDVWRLFHQEEKHFTWSRKTPFVARRLDYILMSDAIFNKSFLCDIISTSQSDHRLVEIKFKVSHVKRGPSYWKFNDSLLRDQAFVNIMNNVIQEFKVQHTNLEPQLKWDLCKAQIREHCISYSTQKSLNQRSLLSDLEGDLNKTDKALGADPTNAQLLTHREEVKKTLEIFAIQEARSAQVRSRIKFIEDGEKNTKYFLNLEKARANAKIMDSLKTEDDRTVTRQNEILEEQVKFYRNVYSKKREFDETRAKEFIKGTQIPSLSTNQSSELEADLRLEEVAKALSIMKNNSAPGPDGITNSFLKFFWTVVRDLVLDSFRASFEMGEMSTTQRQAIITLIHKGKDLPRDALANWRPISLTNSDYKLLAKSIALRVSKVLADIIHENQVGFVKGRKVSTMIRLIDDTIEHMNLTNNPGILLAVDYRRAFDSVSKEFMLWAFKQFGFGDNLIRWVQVITANTMSSVNYLGWISESFPVCSGIRQGCPFSPMAFIIALEILAIKIRADPNIKGLSLPIPTSEVSPSSLLKIIMYADDISLFLQGYNDLNKAFQLINEFSKVSNLELNTNKTEAMWLGSKKDSNEKYFDIGWKKKMKILGIYFSNDTPASSIQENWTSRVENIRNLIVLWSRRNLSISGKMCIIKTFLLSQVVYIMQCLVIPADVLSSLNTLLFRFLWKKKYSNTRAFEKVKRVVVCNTTEHGGLNMINVNDMQSSFLLSWAVGLRHSSGQMWNAIPRFWLSKTGVNLSCFLSDVPSKSFIGLGNIKSMFWRHVLVAWLDNRQKIKTLVSESENRCLWNNASIMYRHNPLFFRDWIEANLCFVSDVFVAGNVITYQRTLEILGHKPSRIFEYNALCTALNSRAAATLANNPDANQEPIPIFKTLPSPRVFRYLLTGYATVRPCATNFWLRRYGLLLSESHWAVASKCTQEERLKLLHWKILHNIYPTNILLNKMGIRNTKNCSYCDEPDFIEHFFWNCPKITKVWETCLNFIIKYTGRSATLTETDVLFGYKPTSISKNATKLINHLILIAKMTISKFKYGIALDIRALFESEVGIRHQFLKQQCQHDN